MAHFVYMVECVDNTLYTGYAKDIKKRVAIHNTAKTGAKYTKSRRPVVLKYSEKFRTLSQALKREAEIKNLSRKQKLILINHANSFN